MALFSLLTNYLLPGILVLSLLVFVHELGHFLFAKLVGIRVERFSIGFPPRLFGKKIGDTDYCISAIPFGGYVKMSGMIDESMDKEGIKGEPWEFNSKPVWARFLVIFAGPMFNILFTVLIFAIGVWISGIAVVDGPIVGDVIPDRPAAAIGLAPGDLITRINDKPVKTWEELQSTIQAHPEVEIELFWTRNGETMSSRITPMKNVIQDVGEIGFYPATHMEKVGFLASINEGVDRTWYWTVLIVKSFGKLFSKQVPLSENVAGPVRIFKMIGDSAQGGYSVLAGFAAILSLHLGLLNLFPFPVLDGGHLVLLLGEAVIRRPINEKFKLVIQQIGMAVLLALMLFVIVNDFINIF